MISSALVTRRNLFIAPYSEPNEQRAAEYALCYANNWTSGLFEQIVEYHSEVRVTFGELFAEMRQYPDDINVIANLDVWFDHTLALLEPNYSHCYAISRHDLHRCDSQDAWVFRGAPNMDCELQLGIPGCDNSLAHMLHRFGYTLSNPAKSVTVHHEHASEIRTYDRRKQKYAPPYYLIEPGEL